MGSKSGHGGVGKVEGVTRPKIGDRRVVNPLIQALNDSDSDVRGMAAYTLGVIGDARATYPLIDLASNDENEQVRKIATSALERFGA